MTMTALGSPVAAEVFVITSEPAERRKVRRSGTPARPVWSAAHVMLCGTETAAHGFLPMPQ